MNIGIDMMGGDFAPLEVVKGIKAYLANAMAKPTITCIGDEQQVTLLLEEHGLLNENVTVVHCSQVIDMHEHPTRALKEKQNSSIAIGFQLLAGGKTDTFISAGNTGAMLIGALYSLRAINGVLRPTISTVVPKLNGAMGLLLDVGLNADCKPENLNQFAILGSLYAKTILDIANPTVGLLNVGEEEGKGNILAQAAYPLLKANTHISFIGNIEGRDVLFDKADVMVCEGFTGNIVLKLAESFYDIAKARQYENDPYLTRFNYENYGGTPVLGVTKPVIIGHGISNYQAFANMINLGQKMIETKICQQMEEAFRPA